MVSKFCPNISRRNDLRLPFGELCRVGTLGIAKRTSEEIRKKRMQLKHEYKEGGYEPVFKMSEGSERNESEGLGCSMSMVFDTFVDEFVRCNIAASIYITLINSKDLEKLDDFYEFIAEFGFEHINVTGYTYNGLIFLNCYGRVFMQETQQALWPLGNSLEEVVKIEI
jgi:hypothetical protein